MALATQYVHKKSKAERIKDKEPLGKQVRADQRQGGYLR